MELQIIAMLQIPREDIKELPIDIAIETLFVRSQARVILNFFQSMKTHVWIKKCVLWEKWGNVYYDAVDSHPDAQKYAVGSRKIPDIARDIINDPNSSEDIVNICTKLLKDYIVYIDFCKRYNCTGNIYF